MLSVTNKPSVLSVVMLSVSMLNVVAPGQQLVSVMNETEWYKMKPNYPNFLPLEHYHSKLKRNNN